MFTCTHCGTTNVLRDEVWELAGTGGVMQDAPSLVRIGEQVEVEGLTLMPVGHARFGYGRGWWDEFWCLDGEGEGHWLSADEGDYALERPLAPGDWPSGFRPSLGATVTIRGETFRVTEAETAVCLAVRGEFPEELEIDEAHLYFDLAGPGGQIATFERWEDGEAWTFGVWLDPWDLRAA